MKEKKMEELKRLLIVVDMVNGFVREGAMADPYIKHIIPEQVNLLEQFKNDNEGIAFVKESHHEGCTEFKKFPPHCIKGTSEAELVKELISYESDAYIYEKNSTSAMFAKNFINDIDAMKNLREIIITGCCTDICIMNLAIPLQNYFDENDRKTVIIVPENAVETYNAPNHNRGEYNEMAFKLMGQSGIQLVKKYEGDKVYGK